VLPLRARVGGSPDPAAKWRGRAGQDGGSNMPVLMEKTELMETLGKTSVELLHQEGQKDRQGQREVPRIRDFLGYGKIFHELRSTEEWMKELREGEE
jgi:hypothetical protein